MKLLLIVACLQVFLNPNLRFVTSQAVQECSWDYGIPGATNSVAGRRRQLIVGGAKADEDEYGWQIALSLGCGGTLIGREWIMTAAHCFPNQNTEIDFEIELAHQSIFRNKAIKKEVFLHPNFDQLTLSNDIALIQIEPLDCDLISDGVEAIGLGIVSTFPAFDLNGCTAWATGTGVTEEGGTLTWAGMVHEIATRVYTQEKCNSDGRYVNSRDVARNEVCAFSDDENEDTCEGDSGGPLKVDIDISSNRHQYVQIAISSWGVGCGRPAYPGVYQLVEPHIEWIKSIYPGVHIHLVTECDRRNYEEGYNWTWYIVLGSIAGFVLCCGILIYCLWDVNNPFCDRNETEDIKQREDISRMRQAHPSVLEFAIR